MSLASNRPWYRLHLVTWLVLLVLGATLWYCQDDERIIYGWPFVSVTGPPHRVVRWPVIAFNPPTCLGVLASTAFVVERRLRLGIRGLQFRLGSLFIFVTAAAAILALRASGIMHWAFVRLGDDQFIAFAPSPVARKPIGVIDHPWYIAIPLLIGIACTMYTVGWLTIRVVRLCTRQTDEKPFGRE